MHALTQVAIVRCSVNAAVFLAARTRLTPVLYFLWIGSLLVNIGILLIMFALGFEESPSRFVSSVKRRWSIALSGAIVPFLVGYAVAEYFRGDYHMSLMCGLAISATPTAC